NRKKISGGDTVTIEGISGTVIAVDSTSFTLKGKKGQIIIIPLSKLLSESYEVKPQDVIPIVPPSGPNPEG
ncbi:MAG: mechanosensitive ion channel domain-containing protein, partial [Bacteroidota bacterium]